MAHCDKCKGTMIYETYCGPQGSCEFFRCVQCGDVVYKDVEEEELDLEEDAHGGKNMKFKDIGRVLGVTRQMAYKIHERALRKVRRLNGKSEESRDRWSL